MTSFRLLKCRPGGSSKEKKNKKNASDHYTSGSNRSSRATLEDNNNVLFVDTNYHHDTNSKNKRDNKKKSMSKRFLITSPSRKQLKDDKQVPKVVNLNQDQNGNVVTTVPLSPIYSNNDKSVASSTPDRTPHLYINNNLNYNSTDDDDRMEGFSDEGSSGDDDDDFDLPPGLYYNTNSSYNVYTTTSPDHTNDSVSQTSSITHEVEEDVGGDLFLKLQTQRYQDNLLLNKSKNKNNNNHSPTSQSEIEDEEQKENESEFKYEETLQQIKDIENKQQQVMSKSRSSSPFTSESYPGLEKSNLHLTNKDKNKIKSLMVKKEGEGLSPNLEQLPPLAPTRAALIQTRSRQQLQQQQQENKDGSHNKFRTLSQTLQGTSTVHDVLENGSYTDSNDDDDHSLSSIEHYHNSVKTFKNKNTSGESVMGIRKPNYTTYTSFENDNDNDDVSNGRIGIDQPLYQNLTPSFILTNQQHQKEFNLPPIPSSRNHKINKPSNKQENLNIDGNQLPECEIVAQRLASSQMKWKYLFLLLIQPKDKIFELIRVSYPPDKTTVGDLLNHLLPLASSTPVLSQQTHIGICRPYSSSSSVVTSTSETKKNNDGSSTTTVVVWDLNQILDTCCTDKNNMKEVNNSKKKKKLNVWIAIPDGQTAKDCQLLGQVVLRQNPKMVQLIKLSSSPREKKGLQLICDLQEENALLSKKQRKLLKKIASSSSNGSRRSSKSSLVDEENKKSEHNIMTEQEIHIEAMKIAKATYIKSVNDMCKKNKIDRKKRKKLLSSFLGMTECATDDNIILSKEKQKDNEINTDNAIYLTPIRGPSFEDNNKHNKRLPRKDLDISPNSLSKTVSYEKEYLLIEETLERVIQTCMDCVRGHSIIDQSSDVSLTETTKDQEKDDEKVRQGFEIMSIVSLLILISRFLTIITASTTKYSFSKNKSEKKEPNSERQVQKEDPQIEPTIDIDISASLSRVTITPPNTVVDNRKEGETSNRLEAAELSQMNNDASLQILPVGMLSFFQAGVSLFLIVFQNQFMSKLNDIKNNDQKNDPSVLMLQISSERIMKLKKVRDMELTSDENRR